MEWYISQPFKSILVYFLFISSWIASETCFHVTQNIMQNLALSHLFLWTTSIYENATYLSNEANINWHKMYIVTLFISHFLTNSCLSLKIKEKRWEISLMIIFHLCCIGNNNYKNTAFVIPLCRLGILVGGGTCFTKLWGRIFYIWSVCINVFRTLKSVKTLAKL